MRGNPPSARALVALPLTQRCSTNRAGPLRIKCYRFGAHRKPLNVRFAPNATELLCPREMTPRGQVWTAPRDIRVIRPLETLSLWRDKSKY